MSLAYDKEHVSLLARPAQGHFKERPRARRKSKVFEARGHYFREPAATQSGEAAGRNSPQEGEGSNEQGKLPRKIPRDRPSRPSPPEGSP